MIDVLILTENFRRSIYHVERVPGGLKKLNTSTMSGEYNDGRTFRIVQRRSFRETCAGITFEDYVNHSEVPLTIEEQTFVAISMRRYREEKAKQNVNAGR